MATTEQLAPGLGCWEGEGLPWRAAASMCREGGARVTTNVLVRDMDVAADPGDARKLEVVADGLPMFRGVQLTIDNVGLRLAV